MARLAIISHAFDQPSETFIRDHVDCIAPGNTVLVARQGAPPEGFDGSFLGLGRRTHRPSEVIDYLLRRALRLSRKPRPARMTRSETKRVREFLGRHGVRTVLIEHGHVGAEFADAVMNAGAAYYVHFHGHDANVLPHHAGFLERYSTLFTTARGIIVTSDFMHRRLASLGCPPDKLHICPVGVDTARFAAPVAKKTGSRIAMVCRLVAQKNPLDAIRAFAGVAAKRPDASLNVVGAGPARGALERLVQQLGIAERVDFHGALTHDAVKTILHRSDIFIQNGQTLPGEGVEAFGLSVVEAMACELPVVAARHGGFAETVRDGKTGYLVDEGDVTGMTDAMIALLDDPAKAVAMGAAGRARVMQYYSQADCCARLADIIGV